MAHYALLDENNIVTNVIVGQDDPGTDWESEYASMFNQKCVQTSYNMHGGVHKLGGQELRKNYAIIGGIYDPDLDAFYEQQPYPSWSLNTNTCLWEPPVPEPRDELKIYRWDEEKLEWYVFRELATPNG